MNGPGHLQYLSTYIVNEVCAFDAGALGMVGTPTEQAKVDHVFLTHAHLDHIAGLPIFLDTVVDLGNETVDVRASAQVLEMLSSHVFNDHLMPDFLRISRQGPVFLRTAAIEPEVPTCIAGLNVTSFPVHHPVPCVAYIIEEGNRAIAIVTDTSPQEAIWQRLQKIPNLKAVLLDCSFPKAQAKLAEISGHMTTEQFVEQARKLSATAPVYAIHIKPRFYDEVTQELKEMQFPTEQIMLPGKDYFFG